MAGTEYEFPASGIDAGRYVVVLQAELRAIASRLVMPEFMLSSDASNANYSSTMVAEGPAVKMFERLQHDMLEDDLTLLRQILAHAVSAGRLPSEALTQTNLRGIPPTLAVHDRLKDAQADQILLRNGAMSVQTMAMRHGLDPEQEHRLIQRNAS
jgi:capsid protein